MNERVALLVEILEDALANMERPTMSAEDIAIERMVKALRHTEIGEVHAALEELGRAQAWLLGAGLEKREAQR